MIFNNNNNNMKQWKNNWLGLLLIGLLINFKFSFFSTTMRNLNNYTVLVSTVAHGTSNWTCCGNYCILGFYSDYKTESWKPKQL